MWPRRCSVYRWRELVAGAGMKSGEPVAPIETAGVAGRERENRKQQTLRVREYRCGAQGRTGS